METITINGGNHRYVSELPEFSEGLPSGVINKVKTDVGATYWAANCNCNYIIICPFRDLVDSIANDHNNKYNVYRCYGGSDKYELKEYISDNKICKIATTFDSFPKLIGWLKDCVGKDLFEWKVLVDEYHLILEDMDFRTGAITNMMNSIKQFKHYTFLSATPMDIDFEIPLLKNLPHYTIKWDGLMKIIPYRIKCSKLNEGLARFIQIFLKEGITLPDINNELKSVEQLFIFMNSVTSIEQIVRSLELPASEVKICCADRKRNKKILKDYEIESAGSPNKKINFFTKKCFQGCNFFSDNALVIVASDGGKKQTLVDISTSMEQIVGRIRVNKEHQNIFRSTIVHMFSTYNRIMSNEEFELKMQEKEQSATALIEGSKNLTPLQLKVYLDRLNLESDIVSVVDNKLERNELKKQSFIYKQKLREAYKDGINIRMEYSKADKFETTN